MLFAVVHQFTASIDFPSDAQKIQKVKLLTDNGHAKQVLLSHALHLKHQLVSSNYNGAACHSMPCLVMSCHVNIVAGEVWWLRLPPHSGAHSAKDEGEGNQ